MRNNLIFRMHVYINNVINFLFFFSEKQNELNRLSSNQVVCIFILFLTLLK